jgi:hypothetical protein
MTFVVLHQEGITDRPSHGGTDREVEGPLAMRERRFLDYPVPPHPVPAEGVAGRCTPSFLAVQLRLMERFEPLSQLKRPSLSIRSRTHSFLAKGPDMSAIFTRTAGANVGTWSNPKPGHATGIALDRER